MTNSYDAQPQDLDDRREREERLGSYQPPTRRESDAGSTRSRLVSNLQASMAEAQDLANIYIDLARQLELQIVLVETKK